MGELVVTREMLAAKFAAVLPHLDERQRRLVLGAEARALGHGGIRLVARAAGVREATVSLGVAELEAGERRWAGCGGPAAAASGPLRPIRGWSRRCWRWWSRRSGGIRCRRCGGRPSRPAPWPGSWPGRGTRCRRARWASCCGPRGSACRPTPRHGGRQHPDRDAQFRYINEQATGLPGPATR